MKFVGTWRNNKRHGVNVSIDGEHSRHEAEWKDDLRHGKMTRYFFTYVQRYTHFQPDNCLILNNKIFNETYNSDTLLSKKDLSLRPEMVFYHDCKPLMALNSNYQKYLE